MKAQFTLLMLAASACALDEQSDELSPTERQDQADVGRIRACMGGTPTSCAQPMLIDCRPHFPPEVCTAGLQQLGACIRVIEQKPSDEQDASPCWEAYDATGPTGHAGFCCLRAAPSSCRGVSSANVVCE